MPVIIRTDIAATVAGLTTITLESPPTPMPELWTGIQFWLTPDWDGGYVTGQYAADHADAALQSKYYHLINDASGALAELGTRDEGVARRVAEFSISSWFSLGTISAQMVNGRKTLNPNIYQAALYVHNDPEETTKAVSLSSSAYSLALVFRAASGLRGGLIGAGRVENEANSANVGWRFGWPDASNEAGSTFWQHSYNDQWTMAVDTANDLPTAVILTGSGNSADAWIYNSGVETSLTHTFTAARFLPTAYQRIALGAPTNQSGACGARRTALAAQWDRRLAGTDLTRLKNFLISNYGPF